MKERIYHFIKEHKWTLFAILVLLIYLSPNIFFPEKARFVIHDNLDSNVVWYKNLAESGKMFAVNNEIIPNSLGGIPRGCYPSQFNFNHSLYLVFAPLLAYNINIIFTHVIAFFSMYVFLRRYVLRSSPEWLITSVSLLFALLPFWPAGGTTIATQPLLLYAFLNILNNDLKLRNWLIVAIIPVFTILIHSNFFFLILIFFYSVWRFYHNRKVNYFFLGSLLLYVIITVLCEYRLFTMQFIEHFESNRSGVNSLGTLNFKGVIGVSILHFLKGHYHFYSLQFPFILIVSFVSIFLAVEKKQKVGVLKLLISTYFISLLFILPNWDLLSQFLSKYHLLGAVSLRFYSLAPLIWFIILAYSSSVILTSNIFAKKALPFVFGLMGVFTFLSINDKDYFGSQYAENSFYRTYFSNETETHASFEEYYKTDFFKRIKEKVPTGNYYVCCIGVRPEILQYNGYWTIDGYYFYYPKKQGNLVNEICREENKKSGHEGVNSRCYLWSDDVFKGKKMLDSLQLNYDLLKSSNVKYLFSEYKIINERLISEVSFASALGKEPIYVYTIR